MKNEDPRQNDDEAEPLTEAELQQLAGGRKARRTGEHRLPDLDPDMFGSGS